MTQSIKLSKLLQDYFYKRLVNQRDSSKMTILSYRDTFKLLLTFAEGHLNKRVVKMEIADLDSNLILKFLEHLEKNRKNCVRTRNNRLAAVRSFLQYASLKDPAILPIVDQVLAIPLKIFDRKLIESLTFEEMQAIINCSNYRTNSGRRDKVLFTLLYNTGARVSEIINIRICDVDFIHAKSILLRGKGRKERTIPLWESTLKELKYWIKQTGASPNDYLFTNRYGEQITRSGVEYRLKISAMLASKECPSLYNKNVTPHIIRHTTAMHLLQSGVDLTVIALWLGHENIITTHHYVEANIRMKQQALNKLTDPKNKFHRFKPNDKLLGFLDSL